MITTNHRVRFCENNFITSSTVLDFSSEMSEFPFLNVHNQERTKVWKPSGYFEITTSNNKLYINDGSDKTATITTGEYATPVILASQIQTQLNSISSGFTVSFTNAFRFSITRSSSFTLKLSTTTNSIASTIGHTSLLDFTGLSRTGDIIANHTSEWSTFDFGYAAPVDFISIIGPIDEIFSLSSTATVTIKGNNILDFSSPAFTKTLTRYDGGVFNFIDDVDSSYRYWKLEIIDKTNINGPSFISVGNIYMGDYQTLSSRNIENGFTQTYNDKSIKQESESGSLFFDKRSKFKTFDSVSLGFLDRSDKKMFDEMFQKLGMTENFYISLDPTGAFTDDLDELTKYVVFNSEPSYRHVIRDIFSISISMRECV